MRSWIASSVTLCNAVIHISITIGNGMLVTSKLGNDGSVRGGVSTLDDDAWANLLLFSDPCSMDAEGRDRFPRLVSSLPSRLSLDCRFWKMAGLPPIDPNAWIISFRYWGSWSDLNQYNILMRLTRSFLSHSTILPNQCCQRNLDNFVDTPLLYSRHIRRWRVAAFDHGIQNLSIELGSFSHNGNQAIDCCWDDCVGPAKGD